MTFTIENYEDGAPVLELKKEVGDDYHGIIIRASEHSDGVSLTVSGVMDTMADISLETLEIDQLIAALQEMRAISHRNHLTEIRRSNRGQ